MGRGFPKRSKRRRHIPFEVRNCNCPILCLFLNVQQTNCQRLSPWSHMGTSDVVCHSQVLLSLYIRCCLLYSAF